MRASDMRPRLEEIRARLREAIDLAEIGDNPFTWAQIARCLGHVWASLRLLNDGTVPDAGEDRTLAAHTQARADLRTLMMEAVALAYLIGEDQAALELAKALICLANADDVIPAMP